MTLVVSLVLAMFSASPALASDALVVEATAGGQAVVPHTHIDGGQGFDVYVFTADGTFEIVSGSGEIDYVVVGGGGGGGTSAYAGGGGGGGEVQTSLNGGVPQAVEAAHRFDIVVGAGGSGGPRSGDFLGTRGSNGGATTLTGPGGFEITALGGGSGGGGTTPDGAGGPSVATGGGGAGQHTTYGLVAGTGGTGTATGFNGRDGYPGGSFGTTGGGGAGAAGSAPGNAGGPGVNLAGRVGGSAGANGVFGAGAAGATIQSTPGVHGATSSGNGGSGAGPVSDGGNGADGVVVIRVPVFTPIFTAASPPSGIVGTAYDYTFTAVGDPAPDAWSVSGDVPPGLSLEDGQLSGTPTTAGAYTFTVTAENDYGTRSAVVTVNVIGLPAAIDAVGSTELEGTVGAVVPSPTVRVLDGSGAPLDGVTVAFTASGTSSLEGVASATTDGDGKATSPTWRLGTGVGDYTLTATVQGDLDPGVEGALSVEFTAAAAAAAAAGREVVTEPAGATNAAAMTTAPRVRLVDAHGNPVAEEGVAVTAAVAAGDGVLGHAADDDAGPTVTRETDADGLIHFDGLVVTGTVGTYVLGFTSGGLTAATSDGFALSAGAAHAFDLAATPDSVAAGEEVEVSARVVDVSGNAVAGTVGDLAWTADAPGTFGDEPTTTDADGEVAATFSPTRTGDATITLSGATLDGAATVTVAPADAADLALVDPAAGFASGTAFTSQPRLERRDAYGNLVPAEPQQQVAATVTGTGCALEGTTTADMVAGVATFDDLGITGSTAHDCTITFAARTMTATQTLRPTVGPVMQLLLATAPSTAASSGTALATQPVLQVADSGGNAVASADVEVTATFDAELTHASTGASATTDESGAATFDGLTLSGVVGIYALEFSAADLQPVSAADLTLSAGAADRLVVATEPQGGRSGDALAVQPVVEIHDDHGNRVILDDTTQVTIALGTDEDGTLGGTTTVTADHGVATFTDLTLSGYVDVDYTLVATADPSLEPATSAAVQVSAGDAVALRVVTAPEGGRAGEVLAQQPAIEVVDAVGNRVILDTTTVVAVALADSTAATLGGTTTLTVDGGLASFTDLTLSGSVKPSYTLTFTAQDLAAAEPADVSIQHGDADMLELAVPAAGWSGNGRPLQAQPTLHLVDAWGNPVTGDPHAVTVVLDDDTAALTGTVTVDVDGGTVQFEDLGLDGRRGAIYELRYELDGTAIETSQELRIPAPVEVPVTPVPDADGQLPAPPAGEAQTIVNGAPTATVVEPTTTGLRVVGGGIELHAAPEGASLDTSAPAGGLRLASSGKVRVAGSGFRPFTRVAVWMFSEPTLLGEIAVDHAGAVDAALALLPSGATGCNHTLQLVGVRPAGEQVAVSLGVEVVPDPFPFTDVAPNAEHAVAIGCAAERGWVAGRSDGSFDEAGAVTRGQAATLLARVLDLAADPRAARRVGETGAHAGGIGAIIDAGLMHGYADGTFQAHRVLTRGQAASLFAAALDLAALPTASAYPDVAGTAHAPAIAALEQIEVLAGFADGRFRPGATISRAQFAAMLVRALARDA